MSARALVVAALLALPVTLSAQPCDAPYTAPFALGERLDYSVTFGMFKAGEGSIEVVSRDTVRGREAWHTRFRVKAGVPFYHVDDALESWIRPVVLPVAPLRPRARRARQEARAARRDLPRARRVPRGRRGGAALGA